MTEIQIWCGLPCPGYQNLGIMGAASPPLVFSPGFHSANDDTPPEPIVPPLGTRVNRMRIVK